MASTFFTVMLVATLVLFIITRLATERLIRHHYAQKSDFFARYPIRPGEIVFLGDSITEGARWDELFPGRPVKNRGINADTVSGVLRRLGDVISGRPAAVFILIGTNDLPWYMYHGNGIVLQTYAAILERLRSESPLTRVFVQSILPRHRMYARRIRGLNNHLALLAQRYDATYIDLFPHFVAADGQLLPAFTNDHLHLLANGYARWVEILTPYLDDLKTRAVDAPFTQFTK